MLIMWSSGTMAPKSRKSEIQAMQTQLRNEPSDTPVAPEAIRSLEELGIQLDSVVERWYTQAVSK